MNNNKFFISFKYAFNGIIYCIKNERNMRFHLCAAVLVLILSSFYELTKGETALLFITISLVISLEAVNSSIEAFVDLASPEYNKLAGIIKDVSAGAVLVSAVFSVVVGIILFWDINVFKKIFFYFSGNILALVGMIILIILSYIFVFKCFKNKKSKNKEVN